jgi:hypothetical protein
MTSNNQKLQNQTGVDDDEKCCSSFFCPSVFIYILIILIITCIIFPYVKCKSCTIR